MSGCGRASLATPGRNIQIVRPLEDVEVMEKDGATFSCEVSHDEVPGQWFWEGSKLRPTDNVRIRQEGARTGGCSGHGPAPRSSSAPAHTEPPLSPGRTYTLIYRRVLAEDAGEIQFVAENAESRAQLRVKGEVGAEGRAGLDGVHVWPAGSAQARTPQARSQDEDSRDSRGGKGVSPPWQEDRGQRSGHEGLLPSLKQILKNSPSGCSECWRGQA